MPLDAEMRVSVVGYFDSFRVLIATQTNRAQAALEITVDENHLKEKTTHKLTLIVIARLIFLGPVSAQTALRTVAGDYEGRLGSLPFHLRLHVRLSSPTTLTGIRRIERPHQSLASS
jgi:hypothetical protein